MIQISLLPKDKKQYLRETRIRSALIGVAIVSLIILLMFAAGILLVSGGYSLSANNLQTQIRKENSKLKNYKKLESQVKKYDSYTSLYDKLISERISWSKALLEIQDVVPTGIQFTNTSIEQSEDGKALKVSVQGIATDRREVAKLVKKLDDSEKFSNVNLSSSNITQDNKADFQMSFDYNP